MKFSARFHECVKTKARKQFLYWWFKESFKMSLYLSKKRLKKREISPNFLEAMNYLSEITKHLKQNLQKDNHEINKDLLPGP